MSDDQFTYRQGETYVLEGDSNRTRDHRPLVFEVRSESQGQRYQGRPSSYRSYSVPRRRFWNYKGYVPNWFQDLCDSVWDRFKLIAITAVASPIIVAKFPALFRALFQP
jgi:hypothetical protein